MEFRIKSRILTLLSFGLILAGCAAISETDPLTGKAIGTIGGGAAGAGLAAVLKAPPTGIALTGLAGASLGYYLTTLRFDSAGIVKVNGKVYTLGQYLFIEIPSDNLFDTNTDEVLPGRKVVLDSIVSVLQRYRNNSNIFISGNTSGFASPRFEHEISERRAGQIAFYLWSHGINNQSGKYNGIYVGYGNSYPLANDLHLRGIRYNSNIQIIAAPCYEDLYWDRKKHHFKKWDNMNFGQNQQSVLLNNDAVASSDAIEAPSQAPGSDENYGNKFADDNVIPKGRTSSSISPSQVAEVISAGQLPV